MQGLLYSCISDMLYSIVLHRFLMIRKGREREVVLLYIKTFYQKAFLNVTPL